MKSFKQTIDTEILDEGVVSSAFNVATTAYITKMLVTPWTNWNAYKLELIDEKGKRTVKKAESKQEKEALSTLNTFIIQLRRLFLTFMSEGMLKVLVGAYLTKSIFMK